LLGKEVRQNEVEALLLEELLCPVCLELLILLNIAFSCCCRFILTLLLFLITSSLADFSRSVRGANDLLLNEEDTLAFIA